MFKVKYVDSIMMLVRLDLNLIVSLFQHTCEVSETVSTTTLITTHKRLFTCCYRKPFYAKLQITMQSLKSYFIKEGLYGQIKFCAALIFQ